MTFGMQDIAHIGMMMYHWTYRIDKTLVNQCACPFVDTLKPILKYQT